MKIRNRHERVAAAPPKPITALIADFGRFWPAQIAPAPRRQGQRLYDAGLMLWAEFDRPGAARAAGDQGPLPASAVPAFGDGGG
jgi:hypothetical protein